MTNSLKLNYLIIDGKNNAISGKRIIKIKPATRCIININEPRMTSDNVTSSTTDFKINKLKPTGGVIAAISILIVTIIPNQTGSKPKFITVGKNNGIIMTRMLIGSINIPKMSNKMLIQIIIAQGDTFKDVIKFAIP